MKSILILLAIPCLFIAGCNSGSSDKEATKQKADSMAAASQRDSLLNAAKMMHRQDSVDAAKTDTTKGQK